jgi:hypothetical protein
MPTFSKESEKTATAADASQVGTWKVKGGTLGEEGIGSRENEALGDANAWLGRRGLVIVAILTIILAIPAYWIFSPGDVKSRRGASAEEQYSEQERFGFGAGRQGSAASAGEGEASGAELTADVDALGRDLLLKVLEAKDEEAKALVSPRFLEDLEYNRAILRSADLEKLEIERQGKYWIQGRTPCQLPSRAEGVPSKVGVAQLRMVFMNGRWKLDELGVAVQ